MPPICVTVLQTPVFWPVLFLFLQDKMAASLAICVCMEYNVWVKVGIKDPFELFSKILGGKIMVALGLLSLFLLIVTISAIVGLVRGLPKAVVRLMTLVLAVIVAFIVAGPVTNAVVQNIQIDGMTLGQMLLNAVRDMEMVGDFVESAPLLQEAVLVMPAFVVAIAVFPVVFLLLSFVSWIVFLFVNKPLRKLIFKDDATVSAGKKVANRFAGMGVGVVTDMLIFGIP